MNSGMLTPNKGAVPKGICGQMCQVPGHSLKMGQDQVVAIKMKSTPMTLRSSTLKKHLTIWRLKCWRSSLMQSHTLGRACY